MEDIRRNNVELLTGSLSLTSLEDGGDTKNMLNLRAKYLLVLTSLSPLLGAVAVIQFAHNKPWTSWGAWLCIAISLVLLCWALLHYAEKNVQKHLFTIKEFESKDLETIAFMLAYLLPLVSSNNIAFNDDWMIEVYTFAIIFLVIAHAGAFHFNPVMGLFGYHFYSVKNEEGISYLLISKEELRRPGREIQTVQLAYNIDLHVGGTNA